jgi:hypothetical protein
MLAVYTCSFHNTRSGKRSNFDTYTWAFVVEGKGEDVGLTEAVGVIVGGCRCGCGWGGRV